MEEMKAIHIDWEGPFSHERASSEFNNEKTDFGVYQLYGTHPIYGFNSLLYIGMAGEQTLSERISQHKRFFGKYWIPRARKVFVGRLMGERPSLSAWSEEIALAEKLLIFSHCPPMNSSGLNVQITKKDREYGYHVFNWGQHGVLLPEVSAQRFSFSDDDMELYST